MKKTGLFEIIANGENSGVEFKRDSATPEKIARECVAFANLKGGMVLLGVEDDGTITGIKRPNCEEWVMDTVFGNYIHPRIIPYYEEVLIEKNCRVGIIRISTGTAKPYVLRHKQREDIYIRAGSTSQLASREQQLRLLQSGGLLHIEMLPVSGSSIEDIDLRRFKDYLARIIADNVIPDSSAGWLERLKSLDLIVDTEFAKNVGSIAGILLFSKKPGRFLPNSGLRITVYQGRDKDYDATTDELIDSSLVELKIPVQEIGRNYETLDPNFFSKTLTFLQAFISHEKISEDGISRKRYWDYPQEVIRELLVNATVHRDWTNANINRIEIYSDRMEVTSFGGLPNTLTLDKIKAGQQYPRNPILIRFSRDYGYMDDRGMGIRRKVIPLMLEHNKHEPVFDITADYFKVILKKLS
ncbi:MAG: putative DNA binding domain-containing protein [Candidatus Aminicenantes bacterium]|nr:putative DNA binding domain-containing protein [Candidatus Aminicenantes bacterium]